MKRINVSTAQKTQAKKERGASMVEYALLVALIAAISVAGVKVLGNSSSTRFSAAASSIQ